MEMRTIVRVEQPLGREEEYAVSTAGSWMELVPRPQRI